MTENTQMTRWVGGSPLGVLARLVLVSILSISLRPRESAPPER